MIETYYVIDDKHIELYDSLEQLNHSNRTLHIISPGRIYASDLDQTKAPTMTLLTKLARSYHTHTP